MGRELRWHLARAGREKLKGLGKTRAPSADRGNPGPLESQLSGRDSICAKTFKTSCAPAIWSARSPSQGWSNGWFPTGFKLKRWSWRRETRPRVPIRQSSSRIDSAEAWNRAIERRPATQEASSRSIAQSFDAFLIERFASEAARSCAQTRPRCARRE